MAEMEKFQFISEISVHTKTLHLICSHESLAHEGR